jgi:hypothetical protein
MSSGTIELTAPQGRVGETTTLTGEAPPCPASFCSRGLETAGFRVAYPCPQLKPKDASAVPRASAENRRLALFGEPPPEYRLETLLFERTFRFDRRLGVAVGADGNSI